MNWERTDSWISTKVKADLFNEPSLKLTQINVETCKHVVQLSGFVDATASMKQGARDRPLGEGRDLGNEPHAIPVTRFLTIHRRQS